MSHEAVDKEKPFNMTIRPVSLPDQTAFYASALLTDLVCIRNDLRVSRIWQPEARKLTDRLVFLVACEVR